jgi:nicotinate phosphoribosyltransferase
MVFPREIEAFEAYAEAMPNNCTFLVDTYDTEEGVQNAVKVGKQLRERGHEMVGIRLDSGDLAKLSILARQILDEGGFPQAKIVASDSLDEYAIVDLKARGAKIDVWGIGTRLATAHDQPALGGVYKLAAIQNEKGAWEPRIKRSETPIKTSNPGKLNVRLFDFMESGTATPAGRVIYNEFDGKDMVSAKVENGDEVALHHHAGIRAMDLLQPVFENGEQVLALPTLQSTRDRALNNWERWARGSEGTKVNTQLESRLYELKMKLLAE